MHNDQKETFRDKLRKTSDQFLGVWMSIFPALGYFFTQALKIFHEFNYVG
ncbi:MAG: hypothetical protein OEN01_02805 [Candidatus Krumholzibacteria bacterium]|nr:hypothetical protein [Candidatus Krumholzibacteria bacterium]